MWRRGPVLALVVIVVAGGALRALAALDQLPGPSADELTYVDAAVQLVEHRVYRHTHYPPGAPVLFALAYVVGGPEWTPGLDLPAAYWAQALVGTTLIVAVFALAALIAGAWAGVAAAAVVALHPPSILSAQRLLSEPLAALLLVSALAVLAWAMRGERPALRRLMLAGVLLGALVLTRANFLVVAFAIAAMLARHGWRVAGALLVPALVVIAPWCVFASYSAGHFVPVATGGADSLYIGTFLAGGGTTYGTKRALAAEVQRAHPRLGAVPWYRLRAKLVLDTVAARHPRLSRDAALAVEARHNLVDEVRTRPVAVGRMVLAKLPRLWWTYSEGRRRREAAVAVHAHHVLLIVSVLLLGAGLVATGDPGLLTCALVLVVMTLQHMLLNALPRYALPLQPVLYAGAAAAAALLVAQRSER